MKKRKTRKRQNGFSLIEVLIALALITLIMAGIFAQISEGQKDSAAEQTKLDLMQESRQFVDQLTRDLRAAGYPNTRNFSSDQGTTASNVAFGLIKLDSKNLWFEGSIDGSGTVYVVRYQLDETNCTPLPCLRRSQAQKQALTPLSQTNTDFETEVQNVANFADGDSTPIFTAFDTTTGSAVSSIDIESNSTGIANINSVAITLKVQSLTPDQKTGRKPVITLLSTVRLHNCSYAYTGAPGAVMGC
jgi:prepilin-type N-terminal cleavage/methylation domain-containing protein